MRKTFISLIVLFNISSLALLTAFLYPEIFASIFLLKDIQLIKIGTLGIGPYLFLPILSLISISASILAFNRQINKKFSFIYAGLLVLATFIVISVTLALLRPLMRIESNILLGESLIFFRIIQDSSLFAFFQIIIGFLIGFLVKKGNNRIAKGILIAGIILSLIISAYSAAACGFSDIRRFNCYSNIGKSSGSADICKKIPEASSLSSSIISDCLYGVAIVRSDISMCGNISSRENKFACYRTIAQIKNDIELCNNLDDQDSIGWCYYQFLEGGGRFTISNCDLIQALDPKEQCYNSVVEKAGDISICEKMSIHKDLCYEKVAFFHRDITICSKIQNQILKDKCVKLLKERSDASFK